MIRISKESLYLQVLEVADTNDSQVSVSYNEDKEECGLPVSQMPTTINKNSSFTTATDTEIVPQPADYDGQYYYYNDLEFLSVYNDDTRTHSYILSKHVGAGRFIIYTFTLEVGEQMIYDGEFRIYAPNGSIKTDVNSARTWLNLGNNQSGVLNLTGAPTYYFGLLDRASAGSAGRAVILTNNCIAKEISISGYVNGTIASNEGASVYLEEWNSAGMLSSTLLTTNYRLDDLNRQNTLLITGQNIGMSAGNYPLVKVVFPTYFTVPTSVWINIIVSYKL